MNGSGRCKRIARRCETTKRVKAQEKLGIESGEEENALIYVYWRE
jgi:hypothetical protein